MQRLNDSSLSRLPSEILLRCFSSSSSLWDVFHLAAKCRRNRQTWLENVNTIYHNISPRCIECRRYAHAFLADQRGTPGGFVQLINQIEHNIPEQSFVVPHLPHNMIRIIGQDIQRSGPIDSDRST